MAIVHEHTALSSVPSAQLWSRLTDAKAWSQWNPTIEWATFEGPLAVRSLLTVKPRGGPQTAFTISEVVPERVLGFGTTFGPLGRMDFRYTLDPEGEQTRVTQRLEIGGLMASQLDAMAGRRIAETMPETVAALARAAE